MRKYLSEESKLKMYRYCSTNLLVKPYVLVNSLVVKKNNHGTLITKYLGHSLNIHVSLSISVWSSGNEDIVIDIPLYFHCPLTNNSMVFTNKTLESRDVHRVKA